MRSPFAGPGRRARAGDPRSLVTTALAAVLAAMVLVAGAVDAATLVTGHSHPTAPAVAQERRFLRSVEAALSEGSDIFELHHGESDQGSAAGGPAWAAALASHPASVVAAAAAAAGFEGLYTDSSAHPDGGTAIATELQRATGVVPRIGAGGRIAFFDLRPLRDRMATHAAGGSSVSRFVVDPAGVAQSRAVYTREAPETGPARWLRREATLVLRPSGPTTGLWVQYWLMTMTPSTEKVSLREHGGAPRRAHLTNERAVMRQDNLFDGVDTTESIWVVAAPSRVPGGARVTSQRAAEVLTATTPPLGEPVAARAPPEAGLVEW